MHRHGTVPRVANAKNKASRIGRNKVEFLVRSKYRTSSLTRRSRIHLSWNLDQDPSQYILERHEDESGNIEKGLLEDDSGERRTCGSCAAGRRTGREHNQAGTAIRNAAGPRASHAVVARS